MTNSKNEKANYRNFRVTEGKMVTFSPNMLRLRAYYDNKAVHKDKIHTKVPNQPGQSSLENAPLNKMIVFMTRHCQSRKTSKITITLL